MSGYIEVMVTGNGRAFLEAGSVCGFLTSPGMASDTPATPEKPISVIMRGGDTLPGVYGVSAMKLMMRVEGVKLLMKERKRFCVVAFLDRIGDFEADLDAVLANREMADG